MRAVAAVRQGQGLGQSDRAPQSGSSSSYGEVASQLWNTYGSAVLVAGTKIFSKGDATATSASVTNGGPPSSSSSPRPFGHSTGVDPPVDGKKLVPPTNIPLPPNSPPRNGGRSPSPSPSSRS